MIRALFLTLSVLFGLSIADARTIHGSGSGLPPPPVVSSISPSSGSTLGGTAVTIKGTNFTGATSASIGGVGITSFLFVNSTTITGVSGASSAGSVAVAVTSPYGTGSTSSLYTYALPIPVVSSVTPGSGSNAGGTPVTIAGLNFSLGASGATFNGAACTSFAVVNNTQITCQTPSGSVGPVSVIVTNTYGSNAANSVFSYNVIGAPTVASIFPTSGPAGGGTLVSIQGTGFTGATGVTVGGVALTSVTQSSDTLILGVTGAGTSGTASVVVTNSAGSNAANTLYTYSNPPSLIEAAGYDTTGFHYTKAMSAANSPTFAAALAAHSNLYLDANTDYSTTGGGGCSSITLSSDQKIFGDTNTVICPVTIAAGTTGAVFRNFNGGSCFSPLTGAGGKNLTFGSGTAISGNLLIQMYYQCGGSPDNTGVGTADVNLTDNLFLYYRMGFAINDGTSGAMVGNRLVQGESQSNNVPFLNFTGNATTPSYGNVSLWYQYATPGGRGSFISGFQDWTQVGIDAEQWDVNRVFGSGGIGDLNDFVSGTGDIRIMGDQGEDGNNAAQPYFRDNANRMLDYSGISGSQWQWLFASGSEQTFLNKDDAYFGLQAFAHQMGSTNCVSGAPAVTCPSPNTNTYWGSTPTLIQWPGYPTALTSGQLSALQDTLIGMTTGRPAGEQPWETPIYDAPPDPNGPNWNVGLAGQPDSTATIQALINAGTNAAYPVLAPGTYYISAPLTLASTQGLHGSGWGNTSIVCKTNTIDAFQGASGQYTYGPNGAVYTLTDITIQGCANGIHFNGLSSTGSGGGEQYVHVFLSHLNMRNIANACIFEDGIYSMDNNLIDYFNCINSNKGMLEQPSSTYTPNTEAIGSAYMDKNVFWHCQFIGDVLPISMVAERTNNLDMYANSLFENNTGGAALFSSTLTIMFVNDDFVNNTPDSNNAVLDGSNNQGALMIASRVQAGANGNGAAMIRGNMSVEGSTFQLDGASTATVWGGSETLSNMYNSYSQDMPLGTINDGFFANNYFPLDATHSVQYGYETGGTFNPVLSTAITSQPQEQLLFGPALNFRY